MKKIILCILLTGIFIFSGCSSSYEHDVINSNLQIIVNNQVQMNENIATIIKNQQIMTNNMYALDQNVKITNQACVAYNNGE